MCHDRPGGVCWHGRPRLSHEAIDVLTRRTLGSKDVIKDCISVALPHAAALGVSEMSAVSPSGIDRQGRPVPIPSSIAEPFWDALRQRRFVLQHCSHCERYIHNPKLRCPTCHSAELTWRPAPQSGTVHSFTVVHRAPSPAFAPFVPYVVALVDLDGVGIRMLSNVVASEIAEVSIGTRVDLDFDDVTDDFTVFRFVVSAPEGGSDDETADAGNGVSFA
jgi:uncharacterized OB-fold protein